MKLLLIFLVGLLPAFSTAQAKVRNVEVKKDQIISVETRLGIATLIQLPERPSSVVIGDQGSFKVEYLDKAVTVKPLFVGARTNLYVYTDFHRFNIELVTSRGRSPDYVVYLKPLNPQPPRELPVRWRPYKTKTGKSPLVLELKRTGSSSDGLVLIDFRMHAKKPLSFSPEAIWITEGEKVRPIEHLYLSDTQASPLSSIHGLVMLKRADFSGISPLKLEIRHDETLTVNIPKAALWN